MKPADGMEEKIAKGEFATDGYDTTMTWIAERYLYGRLREDGELIVPGSDFETFYNSMGVSNIGAFAGIDETIRSLFTLDTATSAQLEDLYVQRLAELDAIALIDDQLQSTSGQDSLQLLVDREVHVDQLTSLSQTAVALVQTIRTDRIGRVADIQASNNAINAQAIFEQNEKTVNDLLLASIANNGSLQAGQITALESIASQCPYTGGTAVFRARGLLTGRSELVFNDSEICGAGEMPLLQNPGNNASVLDQQAFEIFPNPATGSFTVKVVGGEPMLRELQVLDLQGKLLLKRTLAEEEHSTVVNTNGLVSGMYFVKVLEEGKAVFSEKLIVQ
ncbi:MAG TPA: T9SS type A sorting domain-containing protein [Bacteroidetes bacterium]|nr:T9SS type A sorting domain-containing protein [Bacteroidota bacterium]